MFNKLKQFKDLKDQAKNLQNMMADEKETVSKNGITVTINGNFQIESLTIELDLEKDKIADILKEVINDGMKKIQRNIAQKMQGMGGLPSF